MTNKNKHVACAGIRAWSVSLICAVGMLAHGQLRADGASPEADQPPTSGAAPAPPLANQSPPSASGTSSSNPVKLEAVVVKETAESSVLPTDQTVSSVLGTELSVQDTPRSITVVSPELMKN